MDDLCAASKQLLRDILNPHYCDRRPSCPKCRSLSHYLGPALRRGYRGLGTFECDRCHYIFTPAYAPTIPPDLLKVVKETNSRDLDNARAALQTMRHYNLSGGQINSLLGINYRPSRTKAQRASYGTAYRHLHDAFLKLVDRVHEVPVTEQEVENMKALKQAIEVFAPHHWMESLSTIDQTPQHASFSTPSRAPRDVTMYMPSSGASTSTAVSSSAFSSSTSHSTSSRYKGKTPSRPMKRVFEPASSPPHHPSSKRKRKHYSAEPAIEISDDSDVEECPKEGVVHNPPSCHDPKKCTDNFRRIVLVLYPPAIEVPGGLRYLLWVKKTENFLRLDKYSHILGANLPFGTMPAKLEYYCVDAARWLKTSVSESIALGKRDMLVVRCDSASASDYREVLRETYGDINPFVHYDWKED